MSTAHDLPVALRDVAAPPPLRLVPAETLDFDEAVRSVRPRLHRYAFRRLGDLDEAEELVQEALLRAYSHRHQLLTEDDLAAWTTVVTGRLVIDRLRVRGRSTSVAEVPETLRVSRDTAEVVIARDEARVALDALDAMPARQAALLWAREVEGQTYDELCERFRMTEPAVRSVLTRARKALRREYALRGGTLPVGGLAVLAPWLAGLTWAEKLRRATGRLVAPAALGTAGLATLGGLIFGPFSTVPAEQAPTTPFAPAQTVLIERGLAPRPSLPVISLSRAESTTTSQQNRPYGTFVPGTLATCVNDSDANGSNRSAQLPAQTPLAPTAGSGACDAAEATAGDSVTVNAPVPANPLGVEQVGVTSSKIHCADLPSTPFATCTPGPSNQGASR